MRYTCDICEGDFVGDSLKVGTRCYMCARSEAGWRERIQAESVNRDSRATNPKA